LESPAVRAALVQIDRLQDDHARMDQCHAEVDRLGQLWLATGTLSPVDAGRFAQLLSGMAETYREHIAVEEHEVFPVASAALAESERAEMGGEMAARRGLRQN